MIKKRRLFILAILVLFTFLGYALGRSTTRSTQSSPTTSTQTSVKPNNQSFTWLDLSLDYFSKKDVQWGSAGKGNGDKITDYTQAAIKNLAVYQSYPTLNSTITSYENESIPLKNSAPSEINKEISKVVSYGQPQVEDSYKQFGTLISNYLPDRYIWKTDKFDVDGDGLAETIAYTNMTGAADGGSYTSDIIKGNNIIFSVQEDNSMIIPADTSNGFYIEWGQVGDPNAGRCCEEGIKRTRFVFKDNKFIPIYEQEIRYLKVGKE